MGKSTLFNRLVGKRVAVVEDTPGITRDRLYAEVTWNRRHFKLSIPVESYSKTRIHSPEQIRVQANIALSEADIVIFLTDVTDGVHPDDRDLANEIRGIEVPVLVAVNKADNMGREAFAGEFYGLGVGDQVFAISGLSGRGVADMLDEIVHRLPDASELPEKKEEIKLAIVGRPNVGKSSLVNAFTGEQRMIVSNVAGTTRDAIDTELEYADETFRLIDTAGIRRKGKIQGSVEYYMVNRAQKAIDRCDCAMIVINGEEGLTDGDKRVMNSLMMPAKRLFLPSTNGTPKSRPTAYQRSKLSSKRTS